MDNIYNIKTAKFYLPDANVDGIQGCMRCGNYWDMQAHDLIDPFLKDGAVILDIGANIGSHTVYWAIERKAKKIYSFEPFDRVFKILRRNIALNLLSDVVTVINIGLSNENSLAKTAHVWESNLGGTVFVKSKEGATVLRPLDEIEIPETIDLIRIDVEGHEVEVLQGAKETIKKNKPILVIESFHRKEEVENEIFPLGYQLVETIREGEDYIYKYFEK